jgi:hypothetical protein
LVEGLVQVTEATAAVRAVLSLAGEGQQTPETDLRLADKRGGRLRLAVPGEPGSKLRAELRLLDATGAVVAKQDREITVPAPPAWQGTQAGLPLGVLPPWTPMTVQGQTVAMLGKRLSYDELALPATAESAGAELLAAPVRMVVEDTGPVSWTSRTCRVLEQAQDHVQLQSLWRSASLDLQVTSTVEYDGYTWNEVTLTPRGTAQVRRVALEVPLRPERARYAYQGHAQACGALSPLGLRRPLSTNLWVGDEERGLAWLAESLEWVRARDRGRQVEIIPGPRETLWRCTFIDTPVTLSEPYTARFILHVTPAKPVSLRKSRIFHGAYYGLEDARMSGTVRIPAQGRLRLERGTFECWVKPNFDPGEVYDPKVPQSDYNRMFMTLLAQAATARTRS